MYVSVSVCVCLTEYEMNGRGEITRFLAANETKYIFEGNNFKNLNEKESLYSL